jgi:ketosteroid isomerase-like protein
LNVTLADVVVRNAQIDTGNPARPQASAVAITGGRITKVGDDDAIAPYMGESTRVIDARGRRVVRGLHDSLRYVGGRPQLPVLRTFRELTRQIVPPTRAGIVRALLDAIDDRDLDSMDACVADDVHFRFGNADPTDTKADFAATMHRFLRGIAAMRHEVIDIWEVHDGNDIAVIATMDVHYKRLDGQRLTLPCCNVFRVRDGLIHDYRVYMDVNPVIAPDHPPARRRGVPPLASAV